MRTYLVVIDDSAEARTALRFAARRAAKTAGAVEIVALLPPADFVQWGGVQAAMEEEAELRAIAMVQDVAGESTSMMGARPQVSVRRGEGVEVIRDRLTAEPIIAALVLGAPASGGPGPLVSAFSGVEAGALPCPVMIIPGGLSDDAIDRLS